MAFDRQSMFASLFLLVCSSCNVTGVRETSPFDRFERAKKADAAATSLEIPETSKNESRNVPASASSKKQTLQGPGGALHRCRIVRFSCVVDGDTIWLRGTKIRMADIDTPEVHSPKCPEEKILGNRATDRLVELLNEGSFEAVPIGSRDTDKYGRKLRVLVRDGRSIGDQLVHEGLARTWSGRREPWC